MVMHKRVAEPEAGATALALMEQALALLDRDDLAPDVGAHLDLAICRLREVLDADAAARTGPVRSAPGPRTVRSDPAQG